jgi:hypothetical protein
LLEAEAGALRAETSTPGVGPKDPT